MMKSLFENECGGQNPLMKLTNQFTNSSEQKLTQDAIKNLRSLDVSQQQQQQQLSVETLNASSNVNNLVSEYLGLEEKGQLGANAALRRMPAPRTFHMEALLSELKQIDNTNNNNPQLSANQLSNDWSQEYWSSMTNGFQKQAPIIIDDRAFKWSAEYLTPTEATIFDEAWDNLLMRNTNNRLISNNLLSNIENSQTATNQLNDEMRKTANELLDSMQDSRFSETEFLQFVRNLSVNGINSNEKSDSINDLSFIKETNLIEDDDDEDCLNFDKDLLANEWVKEFQSFDDHQNKTTSDDDGLFWNKMQDEWNSAALADSNHPWLEEFHKVFDAYKSYEFDKENPLKSHPNPFDEGLKRLKEHDIVNAVLLFEVAVQKEPINMLAWQYLGTTQMENEQDAQAIRALRRCLDLKPDNLTALSTLATSYTNESMQRLAFNSLVKWLTCHPEYSNIVKDDEHASRLVSDSNNEIQSYMETLSFVEERDFIDLQEIFLKAVRQSMQAPNKIDPDLQCCLGVLFHLSSEYDKAADCFKTALQIKPNDHLLWNKLGATFANSSRNEEAIDAYYQALKLCPGFVRARYNLGIGCMNLGAYKEAVEHFLTALVQQSQANIADSKIDTKSTNKSQQMSETIWSTLRLALSYLNRSDLYADCISRDLEHLKQEFKI